MTSGLSILIPVFNWDVNALVEALLVQQADWPGPVEIILLDDGSREKFRILNRALAGRLGVLYQELPHNIGRAAIRNRLAAAARHEWLLLLDNDSLLPDNQFIIRYAAARHRAPVLIGGTSYAPAPPAEAALYLRWLYGREREARAAAVRQRAPHAQLTINNALLHANVLARFPLDEQLAGYGHEDTRFGQALAQAQIPIIHLDNPVLHAGLEPAAEFLHKSEQAVHTLVQLFRTDQLGDESRLTQTVRRLQRLGLVPATRLALNFLAPVLQRNLLSRRPGLRQFDLLKLHWFLTRL
ncbi:glycosyltransferase [Hymenobacter sp. IS2118]|uniref:glycosyltransferase n=1 Tax=Hymenobacter sp. IS2118 TaxID=1505605 RepID=UPI0009070057|nr:glycosyltransferase [Hymenobacter sp. IS2118]